MSAPVTVLMSTYNRRHFLQQAIEGLLAQSVRPRQIVIVNDGSTDGTAALLAGYRDKLQVIEQANAGKSAALNRAIPAIEQEFVWVFDDDDVPFPDALERHLRCLQRHPEADFSYSASVKAATGPTGQLIPQVPRPPVAVAPEQLFCEMLERCVFLQQGSLVRTPAFVSVGGYSPALYRSLDYDFLLRLTRHHSGVALDHPTFWWRQHDGRRGHAAGPIAAAQRLWHWYGNNKTIFRTLYNSLHLWEYVPHKPGVRPAEVDLRQARLSRFKVAALRGLWPEALDDLGELLAPHNRTEPPLDLASMGRALSQPLAIADLLADEALLSRMLTLMRGDGRSELKTLFAQRCYYAALKNRALHTGPNGLRYLQAISRTMGARGLASLAEQKLAVAFNGAKQQTQVPRNRI